ncbi:hybrid sensor histidine kinase/response regulator [Enhygromyxa salina]|uniref:histidine kinase n=1 Tax=Enhygromyxa salina TaxID=215803 RepID=A0A2S9YLQ9_9BACT|nr:ATP-binding protein [Enhygromyxa salina]PRQ06037.1 Wide host range VirA protein [Enhygromyxa salina]
MADRKSEREGSAAAATSGKIRISASGRDDDATPGDKHLSVMQSAARSLGGGPRQGSDEGGLVDSSALIRSNAMLFLVAAVCTSAFTITELATGHFREVGDHYGWLIWLVVAAALSWLAFGLRERGGQQIWTGLIGIASLNTLLASSSMDSSVILAGVLVILMWCGMLLRPRHNLLLAAYCVLTMWLLGGQFVLTPSQMELQPRAVASGSGEAAAAPVDEGRQYALPVLVTFIAIPLGLGATLHLRQRNAEHSLLASIAKLQEQREELKRRLEGKSNELELSREQLFEAQKLKMVGTMAAGLAHELNNILTPIRGHAELITEGDHKVEQTRRYGQRILDSAISAAQITQALLTYAHKDTYQPVRSNLRQLLQSTILPMLSNALPGNVKLEIELARSVSVDVDRNLFQQAIVNLVFNACDAMPEGGVITVGLTTSTEAASEKAEAADDSEDFNPETERSAIVTVSDNGTGIEEDHLRQIFDPFFTTKAVGSGSGLGLAMVMGTITRHHGRVDVESVVGEGTTFKIYLPLAVTDEKADAPKPWPVLRGDAKGPVVVVLTEDQDALDEFEELLEATECAPICTNDAKGATPLLTEMGDKVDLLILDLEITATDGKRLFKTVRELFPEMPVILLSNQPTDPMLQRMIAAGPTRSVRKPMDNRLFSAVLTDLLNPTEGYLRGDFTPVPITPGADVSGPHPRAG